MNKQNRQRKKLAKKRKRTDRDRPTDTPKERLTDRHTDGRTKTKTTKTEGWKPTWALIQSTFLRLVVMRTAAFPAKIRRWICAGAIALPVPPPQVLPQRDQELQPLQPPWNTKMKNFQNSGDPLRSIDLNLTFGQTAIVW